MKPIKKSLRKFLESRARWNVKIQSNAINDEDVSLIVNTSILGELCAVFLNFKTPKHFQFLDVQSLLETEPDLFFEYLCLEKKHQPEMYAEIHAGMIQNYQRVLTEMYKGNPTLYTFSLVSLVSSLQQKDTFIKPRKIISFPVTLFKDQPKEAIEAIIDLIFFQTNFGLKSTTTLDASCIEVLETKLLEAIWQYDFWFACRILKTLAYINAPKSKATKKAYRFLRKTTPRKQNLTLEIITESKLTKLDEDVEMVKLNKEIITTVLEWKTGFRFYRDLGVL